MGPRFRGDDGEDLFLRGRGAFHKGLAALHFMGERRLVDLDHHGVGIDAEILHQRLRDVAHHAGLLLVGAAGGHAYGDFRHFLSPCALFLSSWPGLSGAYPRSSPSNKTWMPGTRLHKAGHDARSEWLTPLHLMPRQDF